MSRLKKDWNPKNTKVLILGLGLSEWDDPEDEIGHRDLVLHEFFKECGVPNKNNIHIRDDAGDSESLIDFLPDFLADSDEDTLFIFYYSGHGDLIEESELDYDLCFCHPTEESFTLSDLVDAIEENFEGYDILLMADCCYSGNISRFAETVESEYNYAALASSLCTKSSTGEWTFTDCILEALKGEAQIDFDENGTISLQELADYVKEQMKEIEEQKSDFGYSEEFDVEMRLAIVC